MFIDKLYSMEDIDLMWQLINYDTVAEIHTANEAEDQANRN